MIESGATGGPEIDEETRVCVDVFPPVDDDLARSGAAQGEQAASLDSVYAEDPGNPARIAVLKGKRWAPGQTLRIAFMGGGREVQRRVREVAELWTRHANLKFDFDDGPSAQIRIAFMRGEGSWSYIGRDCLSIRRDEPTMNLGWLTRSTPDEECSRVVLHEFGHALGCIHEHQNPDAGIPWDTEAVYKYYMGPPNRWKRADVDSNLFQRYARNVTQFSRFDPRSIMLYAIPKAHTLDRKARPGNSTLSETDIDFIQRMYPRAS
ncbi:hypothetical protein BE21_49960 [Sorangium cellulosum]|uniref:Peptidase metallopeptidase domain-containing protein n=1 Tax=Sorangium cellulosum TaxID=56 RepID=A0A150TGW1_SORCE|nr:hypothetical protein BE21_49960 [Sorangium cellulosum]